MADAKTLAALAKARAIDSSSPPSVAASSLPRYVPSGIEERDRPIAGRKRQFAACARFANRLVPSRVARPAIIGRGYQESEIGNRKSEIGNRKSEIETGSLLPFDFRFTIPV